MKVTILCFLIIKDMLRIFKKSSCIFSIDFTIALGKFMSIIALNSRIYRLMINNFLIIKDNSLWYLEW
jgi:hypothetical protein